MQSKVTIQKISVFSPATCREVEDAIRSALEGVAERYGVGVKVSGGRYSPTTFSPKVEFAVIGADGLAEGSEVKAFRLYAGSYGLKPEDLGRTFSYSGRSFTICGLNPRAPSKPIMARDAMGRGYKFNNRDVARLLNAPA